MSFAPRGAAFAERRRDRPMGGSAGGLLPRRPAGRDDRDRLDARGEPAGRGGGQGGDPARGAPAGPAGAPRPDGVLPRACRRRATRAPAGRRRSPRPRRPTGGSGSPPTRTRPRCDGSIPRRQAAFERSRDPIRRLARQKRWVLTQYPTAGYAEAAGMTLDDYEAFVIRALFLDRARSGGGLEGAGPPPGRAGGVHVGRPVDPDRGGGNRPDPLGGRPHLDQLRRPAQHALRRDLHRADRGLRHRPAAVRLPRLPRRPAAGGDRAGAARWRGRRGPGRGGRGLPAGDARHRPRRPPARRAGAGPQPRHRPLHRQHPLRREDRRDRAPGPGPELSRDRRASMSRPCTGT